MRDNKFVRKIVGYELKLELRRLYCFTLTFTLEHKNIFICVFMR